MNYQILLHGRGIQLLSSEGERKLGGVYVWRTVEAPDVATAVSMASRRILLDPLFLEDIRNEDLRAIGFEAEEILAHGDSPEEGESGYVFYIDDDEQTER